MPATPSSAHAISRLTLLAVGDARRTPDEPKIRRYRLARQAQERAGTPRFVPPHRRP